MKDFQRLCAAAVLALALPALAGHIPCPGIAPPAPEATAAPATTDEADAAGLVLTLLPSLLSVL